jgi:AhpD family alkylhydroperoxidase
VSHTLDPATRELVGVAAAIAGHCQPCFEFHYREALRLGVPPQAVQEAFELARAIRGAGDRHMDEFAARRLASTLSSTAAGNAGTAEGKAV